MNATNALIVGSVGLIAVLLWRSRRRSNSSLLGKSLISIYDLTNNEIMEILKLAKYQKGFRCAQEYKSKCRFANLYCRLFYRHELHSKVVGLLFMEPSTRTRCSFESAAKRLGCSTVSVCDATTSSIKKGETIEDTARMLQGYCDALVIRHPQEGVVSRIREILPSTFPIFNAGDGTGEHPTQALLDLFAIEQDFPERLTNWKDKPLIVTIMGDLAFGRAAHSLSRLLMRFNTKLQFLAPDGLEMPSHVIDELDLIEASAEKFSPKYLTISSLVHALKSSDVVYVTRLQLERFKDKNLPSSFTDDFILTNELLEKHSPKHQIILHPLPRVNEIDISVDSNSRQRYFTQAADGMYIRMALLSTSLGIV